MWSDQTPEHKHNYGLGWGIGTPPSQKLQHAHWVEHSGGLIGASSLLVIYPEEEIVAVTLTNKGRIGGLHQMVLHAVENICHLVK